MGNIFLIFAILVTILGHIVTSFSINSRFSGSSMLQMNNENMNNNNIYNYHDYNYNDDGPGSINDNVLSSHKFLSNNIAKMVNTPVISIAVTTLLASATKVLADDIATTSTSTASQTAVPLKIELGPPPEDFGISGKDFYADCGKVVTHMRYAVQMDKTTPRIAEVAQKTKDEMGDFVSFYRRFNGINGKQSYSLLYTSINVLSGHYTSYGVKFPVPEKRRKRLLQEFNDIEKNIRKKR